MIRKYVPDITTIVNGRITRLVEEDELKGVKIILPNVVFSELEHLAEQGKDSGFSGMSELEQLKQFSDDGLIEFSFDGEEASHISEMSSSETKAMVRDLAKERDAILVTSDEVLSSSAKVEGLEVKYLTPIHEEDFEPKLLDFFESNAMSVHLKENVRPMAKVGRPGNFNIKKVREDPLDSSEMREIAQELSELARRDPDGYIEVEMDGASMIQLGEFRIAIARPPFSDAMEITAVRPVADVDLDDYALSEKLKNRLDEQAEGVLVAGAPGAGKSTFAQALADFYKEQDNVIKTMESPRDLQVDDEVTQYTALEGDMEQTSDILLMVRPDYTIYDELRRGDDFEIFVDMRLAGVGMVGVVHSTKAIDAVQRLIGRVELGMIPMIVDTVIFVEEGGIGEVYALVPTVGVPQGMGSPDLARPMVEVQDFETGEPEYQIYSFGEQIVVMPVEENEVSEAGREKAKEIEELIRDWTDANVDVEMISDQNAVVRATSEDVPRIIGRNGQTVDDLQESLNVRLDIRETDEVISEPSSESSSDKVFIPEVEDVGDCIILKFGTEYKGDHVKIFAGDSLLFKGSVGKNGEISLDKGTKIADQLMNVYEQGIEITAEIE